MEEIELPPDPKRMIEGLRDTGYEFNTAIADIVDNSIAANAAHVDLLVAADFKGNIRVSIADNGDGMDKMGLENAMRYGARVRPNAKSLGKYGLGLKTASTAFCRSLSVTSRASKRAKPLTATWDLDHVGRLGKWNLLLTDEVDPETLDHLEAIAPEHAGTVVVWTKIDRLFSKDYQDKAGKSAAKALEKKIEQLREHLSMVYQRYLDPKDSRARNISMSLNGKPVLAWDPFMKGLSELVAEQIVSVETPDGNEAEFTVRAYVLPRAEEYATPELEKAAKLSADRQGIYIYREDRLIHDADWLDIYQVEPHFTLLRVEFSFDHRLDGAFHLDIKKSQIILNDDLWNFLKDKFLPSPRREANRRYREGEQKKISTKSKGAHDKSNTNIRNREADAGGAKVTVTNPNTGEVLVENPGGKFRLKLPMGAANRPGEVFVQPVEGIANGLLFQPIIIEQHRAVQLNTTHAFYHKVYIPNLNRSVTLQGMDALMWALCVAELTIVSDKTADLFRDMRYEISRILEKLVETLPEPESAQDAA